MNGRRTGGSRLWPSGSNEIRWCNAGCPSLPACLERNPPACRPWPDAQPDAVWADSASGTWHSPMAIFPASHQRIRWLSAGGWERKNWRVFGGPPMYAIWVVAPGNPTLWRGVPVASIQKSFGSSGRDWKPWKKLPIACKFCTYRFIRYSSTFYGKVRINPLMANTINPGFFASPVANAAWFVVVRPCYLNRDLLSGPKGN